MTYLVDANGLSEPTKPSPSSKVIGGLSANERQLVVDPMILGEVCIGILALPRGRKRRPLEQCSARGRAQTGLMSTHLLGVD
jgi:hypothetical protein